MKILFITATRLGDAVLSTGLLRHLMQAYPDSEITVACGKLPAPLMACAPNVVRVIPLVKEKHAGHWRRLWKTVISTHWDMVVDLRDSAVSRLIFAKKCYVYQKPAETMHKVESLAAILGLDTPPDPTLWFDIDTYQEAARLVPQGPPILAIAPAANWRGKQWRAKNFVETVKALTGPEGVMAGWRVMVQAAPDERDQAYPILAAIPHDRRIDMIGSSVLMGAACLGHANFFIGNDSGLMHIAAACGVPTLGLFGPSMHEVYAPWGPHCAYVRTPKTMAQLTSAEDYDWRTTETLMDGLKVNTVIHAAENLLYSVNRQKAATATANANA